MLFRSIRTNCPVSRVRRDEAGVELTSRAGSERFDRVVFACHSDQALAMLEAPSEAERQVLGDLGYASNDVVLHTDTRLLPRRRKAWAAWNYERAPSLSAENAGVCLHYLINRLQPLPWQQPVLVSLNPTRPVAENKVHARIQYSHPVFDQAAIFAQQRVGELQGRRNTWFCGAWCGYGFHEDGLRSGLEAADGVLHSLSHTQQPVLPGAILEEAL